MYMPNKFSNNEHTFLNLQCNFPITLCLHYTHINHECAYDLDCFYFNFVI